MMRTWRQFRWLWIGFIFTIVGTMFAVIGIALGIWSLSVWTSTVSAEGTVTALEARQSSSHGTVGRHRPSSTVYAPIVRYEVNGQTYSTTGRVASGPAAYHIGQKIPIRYRTSQPSIGYVDTFIERWLLPLAFTCMGCLFASIGIIKLWMFRARASREGAVGGPVGKASADLNLENDGLAETSRRTKPPKS